MPRGGKRAGAPSTSYPNRTDLNTQKQMPVAHFNTGQWGTETALNQAQQQMPVAAQPTPQAAPQGPPGGPQPPGQAAAPAPPLVPFAAPTRRPNEPITHGLPTGPGGGPEVLNQPPDTLPDLLDQMARQPYASPAIQALASYVKRGGR